MVNVVDETFGCSGLFWIQKRVFTKSRGGGTKTHLLLRLPYVFDYAVNTNDQITPIG
jgi:prophage tail gpP-like protein